MKTFMMALVAASVALSVPAVAQMRMPQPAPEQDPDMRMPVPGAGGGVKGCWRAKQALYGQYRLSFCLNKGSDGGYQVNGNKLSCSGDIDWSRFGNQLDIRMNRGRCNRSTDWSRDRITCTIDAYGAADGEPAYVPAQLRMPVPNGGGSGPDISRLNCVYQPSSGPYGPVRFVARRDN